MSDVKQKANNEAKKLIDGLDPNDRGGSLEAPYWMEVALSEMVTYMSENIYVDGFQVPRYGVISHLLRATPTFVYGHKAFKDMCKTAFTDGVHIFICEDFLEKLIREEDLSDGTQHGVIPLVMHEMMHKLFEHHKRLRSFPRDIANKAADLSINTRLQLGFPEIEWVPSLRETGLGFQPGDKEKFPELSEETIARDLLLDQRQKPKQKQDGKSEPGQGDPKGKSGKGQPGQGQPGKGSPGKGQPGQGKGKGQPGQGGGEPGDEESDGQGQPGQGQGEKEDPNGQPGGAGDDPAEDFGGDGDDHLIDLKKVAQVMKDNGLEKALSSLGIDDGDDLEQIGAVEKESHLRKIDAVNQAAAQASQMPGGKYPGGHIAEAAGAVMHGFTKGKMHWKLALRQMLLGSGMRYRPSVEEPSSIYHVDEVTGMLGNALYLPVELSHKPQETVLVLIDTSGSVSDSDIKAFLAEIFALKTASSGFGDSASEVIVLSADTVLRGEPVEITDANFAQLMSEGVKIFGRGGTDLGTSLAQAVQLPLFKEKKITGVVYFTDLYAHIPQYEELGLPTDDVQIAYIAAPSTQGSHVAEFAKGVENYARVYEIEEGAEVDLSETALDTPSAPRDRRRPGAR